MKTVIVLENGKYTIVNEDGILEVLRYDMPWRKDDLVGDGLVLSMVQEIETLMHQRDVLIDAIENMGKSVGLISPNAALDGAQALMTCDDMIEVHNSMSPR